MNPLRALTVAVLGSFIFAACSQSSSSSAPPVDSGSEATPGPDDAPVDLADDPTIEVPASAIELPDAADEAEPSDEDGDTDGGEAPDVADESVPAEVGLDEADGPTESAPADGEVLAPTCPGPDCPLVLAPGHLQLWLRGDREVSCEGGRVTRWADLSGRHNDASPPVGKWGPVCGETAGQVNGHAVVMFPRGPEPDALAAEHLEVDFRSLAESALTIAVVEKRADTPVAASWMIGTPLPFPAEIFCDEAASANQSMGMILGYQSPIQLVGSFWGESCQGPGEKVVAPPVQRPSTTIMIFKPGTGMSLFLDGKQGKGNGNGIIDENGLGKLDSSAPGTQPVGFLGRGLIGRGYERMGTPADSRYKGVIAEVIIYNAALNEPDRKLLEAYLQDRWNTAQ